MTTDKQIAANRQNAKNSTGPRTENGKRRSRRNAVRHGLSAETIVDVFEDSADYDALEAAINADYRPRTNFELELVARLVSLLWRLRRAIAIESGLLNIQAEDRRKRRTTNRSLAGKNKLSVFYRLIPSVAPEVQSDFDHSGEQYENVKPSYAESLSNQKSNRSNIARAFLQLANLDQGVFERLGRYEMSLWRQTVQIILLLNSINHNGDETYPNGANRYLTLKNMPRKDRRVLWPPFTPLGRNWT